MKLSMTCFLVMTTVAWHAAGADRAHNIFDDDWTPPKAAATPRPNAATMPSTTPPGADSSSSSSQVTPPNSKPKNPPAVVPVVSTPPVRRPVPTKSEQEAVRKLMKDVYAEQLADRSIPARRKLTEALLSQADKSANVSIDRFVLLAAAVDAAVDAASLPLAFQAADRMARNYDVDGLGIKAEAVAALNPAPVPPDVASENVRAALELTGQLAHVDDLPSAVRVCAALQPTTARDPELRAQVQARLRELGAAKEAGARAARDMEKLKSSPDDPAANLAVGRYLCFVKGEWDGGLLMLAKGSDAVLKRLAAQDLAAPSGADEIARLGDGWWDAAGKLPDAPSRAAVTEHAAALYRRVVEKTTGLRRQLIEKRIAEAAKLSGGVAAKNARATELLPRMEGKGTRDEQGIILLKRGDRIATVESFKPPIAFRIVLQTESTDFRIGYAADQIIFNWENNQDELRIDGGPANRKYKAGAGAVPKKTWVTIDLVVKPDLMTISVDGEQRHAVNADFSKVDQPLSIRAQVSPLLVKSVQKTVPAE